MTAEALNSMERRIDTRLDRVERGLGEVKNDIRRLDGKIDKNQRILEQQMDQGLRQIIDYLDKR